MHTEKEKKDIIIPVLPNTLKGTVITSPIAKTIRPVPGA